ncbi:hypothetical protein F5Y19DRAFT_62259 [Xylariaceae sp. FL1651]|nr:hypothetical protein F5Y19DRAFT_62259 [Xylariaceae sp. FL1651]
MGDHLWMAHFLLRRVAEEFGAKISLQPKPIPGDWKGASLHTNFSTEEMCLECGMKHIESARHETGAINKFSSGVANRGASIRIPRECAAKDYSYFEDRRPASNGDPCEISGIMMETIFGSVKE